ncbi:phage terminase small subunit P27 family [uncultured Brevundimonas sp.]|uniref:phage terminase small subunit P27 family n=1 Tax=uncultured Brevundimonas sp. TaxID=213418 RepID=UPI002626E161|nr:phage terminase small subunit P27 family [uncultured Brevundimonas sp.]
MRSKREKPAAAAASQAPAQAAKGKAPSWLKDDGLKIWNDLGPKLRAARLLSVTDEAAFGRYCRNFGDWLKLRRALDKRGFSYDADTTHGGKLRRADPDFLIADRLERQLLAMEDRFGLNPAERQRIIAARAQVPAGDLFDGEPGSRPADPATTPAEAAAPIDSPTGFLN